MDNINENAKDDLIRSTSSVGLIIADLAELIHQRGIKFRQLEDGSFEPRWKDNNWGDQVDISNTLYKDLPKQWQEENKASAENAIESVIACEGDIEVAAEKIHIDWLNRNSHRASPEQLLPYNQLSEKEKEKDRTIAHITANYLGISFH